MSEPKSSETKRLAIVGGGITGLTSAYYAIQQGQKGSNIDIYEGSHRLGGQIESAWQEDKVINKGPEFIDSTHTELLKICDALGVKLRPSSDQEQQTFQRADGRRMEGEAFMAAFEPVFKEIRRHKAEVLAHPKGILAQKLDQMSLEEYMAHLGAKVPAQPNPSLLTRCKHWFGFGENRVSPEILTMAMQAYVSESGRTPGEINARQFVHEVSSKEGQILESDCAYRVEGGTEKIVDALRTYLQEHGVRFHQNAQVSRIEKKDDRLQLHFQDRALNPASADRMLLALPAYNLSTIEGLEQLGLQEGVRQSLSELQYTNSVKFTVPLKEGVKMQDGNFFSIRGYQAWSALNGQMTFLASANNMQNPKQLVQSVLTDYAQSHGRAPEDIFDRSSGNVVFSNPGKSPCYASPGKGQIRMIEHMTDALSAMASQGVAVAGTFLPLRRDNDYGIGFIENGVVSSQQAIDQLQLVAKNRSPYLKKILNPVEENPALSGVARSM